MQREYVNVAVVGGGIYGCTIASLLSQSIKNVSLYERNSQLLTETSMTNQYRIHRGYHYPRSVSTIHECIESSQKFEAMYPEAVMREQINYYAIASNHSQTSPQVYLQVLEENNLPYQVCDKTGIDLQGIDLLISSTENLYDPFILRKNLLENLNKTNVQVKCNMAFSEEMAKNYDFVIFCCYSANETFNVIRDDEKKFKFQVVEKLIIEPPSQLNFKSLVIMDGQFCCIDSFGRTGKSVLGHVKHAVHEEYEASFLRKIDYTKELSKSLKSRYISKKDEILAACSNFIPDIKDAKYIDSMWSIRKVINDPKTDSRTSEVICNEKFVSVFSGKVSSSLKCANEVIRYINNAI